MQMLGKRVYLKVVDPSTTESGITIDITNKEKPDRDWETPSSFSTTVSS